MFRFAAIFNILVGYRIFRETGLVSLLPGSMVIIFDIALVI